MGYKKQITIIITIVFILAGASVYLLLGNEKAEYTENTGNEVSAAEFSEETEPEHPVPAESLQNNVQPINMTQPEICVHICGAVEVPGIYSLPAGSRLYEAVECAGGFMETAEQAYQNLSEILTDGTKYYIPTKEECKDGSALFRLYEEGKNKTEETNFPININTATEEELMQLPGIGSAKAKSILSYRTQHGFFSDTKELLSVSGIGEQMLAQMQAYITVME